ncbi:MAG: hypothetical protein DLD55_00920 [candidate division SR1 bacterium]|nr:MAG: hypothetical protein DLD55_00920 [candidate division SR1 bacterium]
MSVSFPKNVRMFLLKGIYLSLKRYISFSQEVYIFLSRGIYLSLKRYISFSQEVYIFLSRGIYLFCARKKEVLAFGQEIAIFYLFSKSFFENLRGEKNWLVSSSLFEDGVAMTTIMLVKGGASPSLNHPTHFFSQEKVSKKCKNQQSK